MARSVLKHLLVYALVAAVWASSSGFSLVAVQVAGELGMASTEGDYPCAGNDCGCVSAEICRTSCTCRPVEPAASGCVPIYNVVVS